MQITEYKGFTVTLSDEDTNKLNKAWKDARKHWRCIVYDKANRKQMGFDVFGGSKVTMKPLEALYCYIEDACDYININDVEDVMNEFGYEDYSEARTIFLKLQKAYYKCRRFIGDDNIIIDIANELREEWG